MKAVAYIRVSTSNQVEDGVSLELQRTKVESWAQLHDAELLDVVADEGLSAKSVNRPGLQRAVELAKRHRAALVVYSLSRLSRSTRDTLHLVAELEKAGCELVSLSEKIDTSSAGGRMVFRMLSVLNEFEREQLAERTRAAMQHLKAQGRVVGSVPHGYARDGDELVLSVAEQRVVDLAQQLRGKGLSLRAISDELAARGAFNRAGRPFNPKSVRSMLAA
jgi:site-specific DNA recombinase